MQAHSRFVFCTSVLVCSLSETKNASLTRLICFSRYRVVPRICIARICPQKIMRTKKFTNVMTRKSQGEVEIESGRWRMILVNEPRHSQLGSGNGAEVVEAYGGRFSLRREKTCWRKGCAEPEEQEETCVGRNFGETKSKSITWTTNHEEKTRRTETWIKLRVRRG